ncbi:uncharacterized protein SAPINGB_P002748 [Magnusiomyces paraingens]|uniref:BAG domain-containing protein n=1 Tax=Magnusiomyces paraingens TaxID=2606893 RepID=A0A5E8BL98_9ASCO|nr:uncharacterized protein SAPINGB_P002748 [Saprochaete ingens]VVT50408.1 unnamed protein product [Saprochaete ingens]
MSISTLSSSDKSKFSSYKEKLRSLSISKQGKQQPEESKQPIDFDPDAIIDDFYADNNVPETKSDTEVNGVYLHYKDRPFRIKFTRTDKKDELTVGRLKLIASMLLTPELIDSKIEELKPIRKYHKKSQLKTVISTDSLRNCYKDESIQPLDIYCFDLALYEKQLIDNNRSLVSYGVYTPSHIFVTVREEVKLPGMRGFKAKVSSKLNGAPAERKLSTSSTPNSVRRPSAAVPDQARTLSTANKSASVTLDSVPKTVPVAAAASTTATASAVTTSDNTEESKTTEPELEKSSDEVNEITEQDEADAILENETSVALNDNVENEIYEERQENEDNTDDKDKAEPEDGLNDEVSPKEDIDKETDTENGEAFEPIDEVKEKGTEKHLENAEEKLGLNGEVTKLNGTSKKSTFGPRKEIDDILADVEKDIVPELNEFISNVPKDEDDRIHNHLAIYENLLDKISLLKAVDILSELEDAELPSGEVPLSEKRRLAIKTIYQYLAKTNKALHDSEF